MMRLLALRRARQACDRAAEVYRLAWFFAGIGDLCLAGRLREIANLRGGAAMDALDAAEPYLPTDFTEASP